jgi:hypothetical protein
MKSFVSRVLDEGELEQYESLLKKRGLVLEFRKLMTKILMKRLHDKGYPSPEREMKEGNWAIRRAHRDGAACEVEVLLQLLGEE